MTHKQKIRARALYTNDILTPLERRRKALAMKALTKEKIEEVQALIESGVTRKEIAEKAGVGLATVDRIKSGQLTAEGRTDRPAKPKATKQADIRGTGDRAGADNAARVGRAQSADRAGCKGVCGYRMCHPCRQLQSRADIWTSDRRADDFGR